MRLRVRWAIPRVGTPTVVYKVHMYFAPAGEGGSLEEIEETHHGLEYWLQHLRGNVLLNPSHPRCVTSYTLSGPVYMYTRSLDLDSCPFSVLVISHGTFVARLYYL